MSILDVHLYGLRSATLDVDRRGRPRLTHTGEAVERLGVGRRWLSLNLPVRSEPYVGRDGALQFAEALLPEGETARALIAGRFGLDHDDTLGLLAQIGREVAGAVSVVPAGRKPVSPDATWRPVDEAEVADRLRRLPREPLGVDDEVRLSLAGAQPKLLLAQTADGRWALPIHGAPSTHILKPAQDDRWPGLVGNEAFCMRLFAAAELPAAHVDTTTFDGVETLVIERFDRVRHGRGIGRIHQEDFVGALGIRPAGKYATNPKTGVTLRRMADLLRRHADEGQVSRLARLVVANTAAGNADAHGRNYGLLLHRDGTVELAPAYDVVCTVAYPNLDRKHSIPIDGAQQHDKITTARLVREVASWGIDHGRADEIVRSTLAQLRDAVEVAADATPQVPDQVIRHVSRNLGGLLSPNGGSATPPAWPTGIPSQRAASGTQTERCGSTATADGRPCRNPTSGPGGRCHHHR